MQAQFPYSDLFAKDLSDDDKKAAFNINSRDATAPLAVKASANEAPTKKAHARKAPATETPGPTADAAGVGKIESGITEIVLPAADNLEFVLPTLAHLSRKHPDRWFTWFPPPGITKTLLREFGFNFSNLRIVFPKNSEQQLWYVWEALTEGTSHTVVAHLGKLSEKRLGQLDHAAKVGSCTGLLIRYR